MTTVTVNFIGAVAPGVPRQMVLSLDDQATVRSLIEELARRGGEGLRRAIWTADGRVERSVLIALDGEVVEPDRLDGPLTSSSDAAEVSLFLIRPIFGGQQAAEKGPSAEVRLGRSSLNVQRVRLARRIPRRLASGPF